MKKQQGFTLIELIVVIVILGILAATALPKFVDLSADAKVAAVKGIAGGIASSASIQYGGSLVNSAVYGAYSSSVACAGTYLQGGLDTVRYSTAASGSSCTVTDNTYAAASATVALP